MELLNKNPRAEIHFADAKNENRDAVAENWGAGNHFMGAQIHFAGTENGSRNAVVKNADAKNQFAGAMEGNWGLLNENADA